MTDKMRLKSWATRLVAAASATWLLAPVNASLAEEARIRVMTYAGAYTSLPVHVANEIGFYANNNLDAELVVVNSGPAGVAALLGGSIDFVEPPTDQIIQNVVKGTDLKVVVGNEVKNFYKLIAADKKSLPNAEKGYPDVIRDLKGKNIGVNALGSTTHLIMNAILRDVGMSPDDVNYVAVGSATTALAAWQAGRTDVQVAFTPFPEIISALGTGEAILDLSKGEGPAVLQELGGAFEGFSTSGAFIEENPEIVEAFIKAHVETITWMKDPANREKLTELVNKHVNVSVIPEELRQETVEKMIDNYTAYLGYTVDPAVIDAWNQYLLENDLISRPAKPDEVIYSGAPKP